jgi:uncharacterized OB-fold protein
VTDRSWTTGTVWSATIVRIPVGDRIPPYHLAYVDLDNGPRVLVHAATETAEAIAIGTRVEVSGLTPSGDVLVVSS